MDISNTSQALALIPLLNEYETTIDTLTSEILFYTKEQDALRNEITILINENKTLAETINQLLDWQKNHQCVVCDKNLLENELIQNLKAQLSCAQKEKDSAVELWQTALRTLDNVECTIGLYERKSHGYLSSAQVSNMKVMYENKIAKLNDEVQRYQTDLDNCRMTLNTKNNKLTKILEQYTATHNLTKCLEGDVQHLNKKLQDLTKVRDELQTKIELKNKKISLLQTKDMEAKKKVSEALQIVEAACFEKDAALTRENETKQEVINISKSLSELIDETTEKVKTETENIKQGYNNKLQKIQNNLINLQRQLDEKDAELNKCLRESLLLNQELDRIRRGQVCVDESHTSKLLILEKNLESTFQKLLLSEKKNLQLEAEKESLKCDLEQMANCYKNDIKVRDTEKEVMKKQLKTLKVQLRASDSNVVQAVNKANKLKAQIKHLDVVIQEKLKQQQILHEQVLSKSIEGIQTNSTQIQSELQRHVQMQRSLNKKVKKEMVEIINDLEKRMEEFKLAKKSLQRDLQNVINDNLYYKENLRHFCTKVMNLADNTSVNQTNENTINP